MNYLLASRRQRHNCRGLGVLPPSEQRRLVVRSCWRRFINSRECHTRLWSLLSLLVLIFSSQFGETGEERAWQGCWYGQTWERRAAGCALPHEKRRRKAFLSGGLLVCRKRVMERKKNEIKQPPKFHLIMHVINICLSPYSSHELCWGDASGAAQ